MCTNGPQVPCEVPSLPNPTTRKGWPHHRGLRPLLFSNSDVGSFTSHKNKSVKVLWNGTQGFSSLSEKTRKINHLQMSLERQHFLLSYLKTLSVVPAGGGGGLNPRLPTRQTGALPTEPTSYVKLFLGISLNVFSGGNRDAGLISPFTNQCLRISDMYCQTGWTTMNMFAREMVRTPLYGLFGDVPQDRVWFLTSLF